MELMQLREKERELMMLHEEIEQAEEQKGEPGGLERRPLPRRGLENALEARRGRGEAHLGDAH